MSVGAPVLYVAVDDALYSINVNSAKATLVGNGSSYFGALLYEKEDTLRRRGEFPLRDLHREYEDRG